MQRDDFIVGQDDLLLVTGATGFIGSRVVGSLLDLGFRNLRCFARPSGEVARVEALAGHRRDGARVEVVKGNLLSREDCAAATKGSPGRRQSVGDRDRTWPVGLCDLFAFF